MGAETTTPTKASIATVSANDAALRDRWSSIYIWDHASVSANIGEQTTYNAEPRPTICSRNKGILFGATVDSAMFSGAQVSGVGSNEMHANLASGQINNFAMQGGTIENAAITNGSASLVGNHGDVSLDEVKSSNAQYEDMLSIESGTAYDLRTQGTAESQHGSMGSANINNVTVVQPQSISQVGQASLTNGRIHHSGNGQKRFDGRQSSGSKRYSSRRNRYG